MSPGEIIISPAQIATCLPFQMSKSSEHRHTVAHEAHEELVPRQGAIAVDVVGFKDATRFLRCRCSVQPGGVLGWAIRSLKNGKIAGKEASKMEV